MGSLVNVLTDESPEPGGLTPRFLGLGYLAFGAAILFAPRPSKAMALATGAFGALMGFSAIQQWRATNAVQVRKEMRALAAGGPLGETLPESLARTKDAAGKKKVVHAPTLEDRLAIITKLTRVGAEEPQVRAKALGVLTRKCGALPNRKWCIPEKDWAAEIKAIFAAYRDPNEDISVRYVRDPLTKDTFNSALNTLKLAGGDCDDSAIALGALLMSVGYPVKMRVVQAKGAPSWSHIYLLVGSQPGSPKASPEWKPLLYTSATREQKWMPLDATVNKAAGWEAPARMIQRTKDFDVA